MYDSQQSSVELFWGIQEIIVHIEVHSTLHKKWTILTRLLFNYCDELKKLSYKLEFIAHYNGIELYLRASCWINLTIWRK